MNGAKRNILIVSPNLQDHMTDKLAVSLAAADSVKSVAVAGASRGDRPAGKNKIVLARFESSKFAGRILRYFAFFRGVKRLLRGADAVVSWSLDAAFICVLAAKVFALKRKKFVYFYSDVHPCCTHKNRIIAAAARFIECFTARRADVVAFTSPLFKDEYFGRLCGLKIKNYVIIENKIPPAYAEKVLSNYDPSKRDFSKLSIGYFGILSYKDALHFMNAAAESGIRTLLRGKINPSLAGSVSPSILFGGPYRNPDDIAGMFESINASYIIHNFSPDANYQWQMTNRFYDALMMRTPIIVQRGTAHENIVLKRDIGMSIDIYNVGESIGKLKSITAADLSRWAANISAMDKTEWLLTDEYDRLAAKLFNT